MNSTLALREEHWQNLIEALDLADETAAFILAGNAADDRELTFYGRSLRWIPEEHYLERTANSLIISSVGYVPSLGAAADDASVPVFVHTHPQMSADPSPRDDGVDAVLRDPALIRSRASFYVSLIVAGTKEAPTFSGRVYDENGLVGELDRLRVVGNRIRLFHAESTDETDPNAEIFDRQIRAFGEEGQKMLGRLRVGVVGVGGTGSAVFEQLVRNGVRQLTVIDDDKVSPTNITRIHESGLGDDGRPKVDVAETVAERIGLSAEVTPIDGRITDPEVAKSLRHLDVVFGCTDDERGRNTLAKLALTHLIPVFDMGFVIDTNQDGSIRALDGRVTRLLPGAGCLLCRQRITPQGLSAEALDPEERERRAGEGYVRALTRRDPAVGTFTTLIGSFAVNEMLDRLFGYSEGAATWSSTEFVLRLHDRRLSWNSRAPVGNHWCGNANNYGRGDTSTL
jgi:molybdopterin/thiamine biosynthesis adenylyltransferase